MLESFADFPSTEDMIKIPGFRDSGVVCSYSESDTPYYEENIYNLLRNTKKECIQIYNDIGTLHFCLDGYSYFNNFNLGSHSNYFSKSNHIYSQTEGGDKCGHQNYKLIAKYECDNSVKDKSIYIPTFWHDSDNCTFHTIVKSRSICYHTNYTEELVKIKCITKSKYKIGQIRNL